MIILDLRCLQLERIMRRVTIDEVAKVLGKDQSTVHRIESGKISLRVRDLLALLNYYGSSVAKVFRCIPTEGVEPHAF